jgi:hypothetical protein
MSLRRINIAWALFGTIIMAGGSDASPLDQYHWKKRVLVVVAPAGDQAAEEQRRIYQSSAKGMSERSIVLTDATDDSARVHEASGPNFHLTESASGSS